MENNDNQNNDIQNNEEFKQASLGPSIAYGIGFWLVYVAIVFTVLGVFFRIPF